MSERTCRKCGCTDLDCRGCIEKTGQPCHWVEPDLCSACADQADTCPWSGQPCFYIDQNTCGTCGVVINQE